MIPKQCKRLAEVDFPIAVVSKHAAREKSIRQGHPSTLHLWWARRPVASSRAVLLALLLPDPCDANCPRDFKVRARELLPQVGCGSGETDERLREGLLKFIGDFANWDVAAHPTYLTVSRGLVHAAHPGEAPLVVDPFSGGGSIPLEALRLGCDAFATDLNPVACLILKVMLEDIPRRGPGLADQLREIGSRIKAQAERELGDFYPADPDGARPIAYLWARTVRCEAPTCGAEIPLVRSLWLSKKVTRRRALRAIVTRPSGQVPEVAFEVFEPRTEAEVEKGSVSRAKAKCLCCPSTLMPERVRAQLALQHGGADVLFDDGGSRIGGARLLAVVIQKGEREIREYRLPIDGDYAPVRSAASEVARLIREWEEGGKNGSCPVPDEPVPLMSGTFNVPLYGMSRWGDLFTARQMLTLCRLMQMLAAARSGPELTEILALSVSRLTDIFNALCRWENTKTQVRNLFGRQALPMMWDFAEAGALGEAAGDHSTTLNTMIKVVEQLCGAQLAPGQVQLADATNHPLPSGAASVWFTDPPYYFAVPYADLSDFFYVWLRRALPDHPLLRDRLDPANALTPKERELCAMAHWDSARYAHKDDRFFELGMREAFEEGRRVLQDDGIAGVVFAHKTTEGWEALLSGMISGGLTITASWPLATELANRMRAKESAALATSVHLVCRPRTESNVGEWSNILRELPPRVAQWMQRLQAEHVRGADLVFACIGPALEIFSRYERVETAEGREVPLAEYLPKVWEVVGRAALEQVLGEGTSALEEDARLTALFLWTLQSSNGIAAEEAPDSDEEIDDDDDEAPAKKKTGGYTLIFDVARRFAQPLGIRLPDWEGRVIATDKGVVRLLPVAERARQLFGEDGTRAAAEAYERDPVAAPQLVLFPDDPPSVLAPNVRGRRKATKTESGLAPSDGQTRRDATTLDRVHAAMLLQRGGQSNALRSMLGAEQDRGPDFLRLANALSALYPRASEEKRLLDAMLLAVPR